jgi:hypothetical protein
MIIIILFLVTQNMVLDLDMIVILFYMKPQIIKKKIFQGYLIVMEKMKVPMKEI